MLSMLAKLKRSNNETTSGDIREAMDIDDGGATTELSKTEMLTLSEQVDVQAQKLRSLVNGQSIAPEDIALIDEMLKTFEDEAHDIEVAFSELHSTLTLGERKTDELLASIRGLLNDDSTQEEPAIHISSGMEQRTAITNTNTNSPRYTTPLGQKILQTTPRAQRRGSAIDFDAFPQTPTLEDIGLSQGALEVVGVANNRKIAATRSSKLIHNASDSDNASYLCRSIGSDSVATPRLTYLQSSSSTMGSAPKYTSDMQGVEPSKLAHQISSTPTVVNSPDQNSPFASSSTVLFGRMRRKPASDVFSGSDF